MRKCIHCQVCKCINKCTCESERSELDTNDLLHFSQPLPFELEQTKRCRCKTSFRCPYTIFPDFSPISLAVSFPPEFSLICVNAEIQIMTLSPVIWQAGNPIGRPVMRTAYTHGCDLVNQLVSRPPGLVPTCGALCAACVDDTPRRQRL